MTTKEKTDAVIAAIKEHEAVYSAAKAPATPAAYNNELVEGLRKGLVEKITAIFFDK